MKDSAPSDRGFPARPSTDECYVCYDGWVYLGFDSGAEQDGELVEITDRVPCRRCADVAY